MREVRDESETIVSIPLRKFLRELGTEFEKLDEKVSIPLRKFLRLAILGSIPAAKWFPSL